MSAAAAFGRRIGGHFLIYASTPLVGFVTSIATLVVLTRMLPPGEYGRLAVLLMFSSFVTTACNLGSLQGTFRAGFSVDEDAGVGADEGAAASDPKRAIGTGFVFTSVVAVVATAAAAAAAAPLSSLLVGTRDHAAAVVWAAAAGGLAAVWRLANNILRLDRRPLAFVLVHGSRSALSLGAAVPLVLAGASIEGVMAGWAIGTAASLALALIAGRRNVAAAFDRKTLADILRRGAPLISVVLGFWVIENGDVFILSRYVEHDAVGEYRVGARIGAFAAYGVSAYLMAWGPLSRESLYLAAERERGKRPLQSLIVTYFAAGVLGLALALAAFGDVMVRMSPAEYAAAAALVPLLALRWVTKGLFQTAYRTTESPAKVRAFAILTPLCAAIFVGLAILLAPAWGGEGVAAAACIAPLAGVAGMALVERRRGERLPFDRLRLTAIVIVAGCCYLAVRAVSGDVWVDYLARIAILLAYPLLLVATGVIHAAHLRALLLQRRERTMREIQTRMRALPLQDTALLRSLARHSVTLDELSRATGLPQDELAARFVSVLRHVAEIGPARPMDAAVGRYLLAGGSTTERDVLVRQLWAAGVDPHEIDRLLQAVRAVRRMRRSRGDEQRPNAPGGARPRGAT